MIIDAHNHPNWHGHNIEKIIANMDRYGIDVTWLHSWEAEFEHEYGFVKDHYIDPRDTHLRDPLPFSGVVDAVQLFRERFVPFFAPHPKKPTPVGRLKMAMDMYGVRGVGEWKFRVPIDDPDCVEVFRFAGENGMPVTLHMDVPWLPDGQNGFKKADFWYAGTSENLVRAMEAAPDTVFLGHGPGFWRYIAADEKSAPEMRPPAPMKDKGLLWDLMERYDNLYADMSAGSGYNALTRQPDGGEEFLTTFSSKVLFARDYFDDNHRQHLQSLSLPDDVRNAVMGGNALRLVPIEVE